MARQQLPFAHARLRQRGMAATTSPNVPSYTSLVFD
jgi:hypothetical protein